MLNSRMKTYRFAMGIDVFLVLFLSCSVILFIIFYRIYMSRNYGLGSRVMEDAGAIALRAMAMRGDYSFSSAATTAARWELACAEFRENGIRKMENITRADVINYGEKLADKVENGELSAATAQNRISAVNMVMEFARKDKEVWASPTKDCGIEKRNGIATESRAISGERHADAIDRLSPRAAALLDLQRELGLRHKESMLININSAIAQYNKTGNIKIIDGTKGGRARIIPIEKQSQKDALTRASTIQGNEKAMIPAGMNYIQASREIYREMSDVNIRQHGERHHYAQARYEEIMGVKCPVATGIKHGNAHHKYIATQLKITIRDAKTKDQITRLRIAHELGHSRTGITNSYLG